MLGRYAKWLLERADAGQRGELDNVMAGVCERCLDHNRRVQVGVGGGWDAGRCSGARVHGVKCRSALLRGKGLINDGSSTRSSCFPCTASGRFSRPHHPALAVQESACGSVATFLEEGEPERHMAPYMAAVLQTLASALQVRTTHLLALGLAGAGGDSKLFLACAVHSTACRAWQRYARPTIQNSRT